MLTKSFYIYIHYIYSLKAKQKQNKIISQLVRDLIFLVPFFFYYSILMIKQIDVQQDEVVVIGCFMLTKPHLHSYGFGYIILNYERK